MSGNDAKRRIFGLNTGYFEIADQFQQRHAAEINPYAAQYVWIKQEHMDLKSMLVALQGIDKIIFEQLV